MSSNALAGPEYGIAIVIYLVIMLLVGAYFGKKSKEDKDGFLLAGRELPVIVLVGTLLATWFGGGTVVGGANFIYQTGPWAGVFYFIGAPLGALVLMQLAPRIRTMSKYTVPEILEQKYGTKTRFLASICVLLAYTGIVSYNFTGAAHVVNLVTGFSENVLSYNCRGNYGVLGRHCGNEFCRMDRRFERRINFCRHGRWTLFCGIVCRRIYRNVYFSYACTGKYKRRTFFASACRIQFPSFLPVYG